MRRCLRRLSTGTWIAEWIAGRGPRAEGYPMKRPTLLTEAILCVVLNLSLAGCGDKVKADPELEDPPPAKVEHEQGASLLKVDHLERFPVATARRHASAPELNVTGVVSADIARNVPVISLASGRVVEIRARLGDEVTKGQLLMRIQSPDITAAFLEYRKAKADESLARVQLDRARLLYSKGAIAKKELEVAQETEEKTDVEVEAAIDHLTILGADIKHQSPVVDIFAPASGIIIEQNVTAAAGVKTLDNSPNLFTIADLSRVWIICDVYENDLANVHLNEFADIRLNAYPGRVLKGRIGNIGSILDPSIRTAKVRVEMENPGLMRLGMFVQATFHGQQKQVRAVVPASAILHLHDRDWVYVSQGGAIFRRVEVLSGQMVLPGQQEIVSGIRPGERVLTNALLLQNPSEQSGHP
jgi:membrane fusion protein, heavy metal efflux system